MYSILNLEQLITLNGVPNAHGKFYVYKLGRTELADIWYDPNGETILPNPLDLDNLGMGVIYVSNLYDYTVVCCDPYNNELFSRDIFVNSTGEGGNSRLYEGLDPIVVNNEKLVISAKKATLSVQDPLYFVEDSQSAVCIGLQESAYSGLPYVENSAIELDPSGNISAISGYPFHSDSADNATSAESAGIVTDGWETGSDGRITAYNGTAFSAGKVYSGISPVYVDNENDKIGVSSKDFLANSPLYFTEYSDRVELSISGLPPTPGLMYESGFNYESGKITGYNGSGISAGKVYSGISPITVDNEADTISLASAILGVQAPLYFVEDSESATIIGVDTGALVIDIPQSADWQNATNIISSNSGNWDEVYSTVNNNSGSWTSAADELAVLNTAKWDSTCDYVSSHSASWNSVNDKLDSAIYATDSAKFITALPGSANWNNAYFEILAHSATWNDVSAKLSIATYAADSGNFLTANQPITQSADWNSAASAVSAGYTNWDSTYDTVSNNSASWTGGAGGGLPMNISDSAVFDSGFIDDNQYCPGLYLSGNMNNYPSIQVRGGYSTEGESATVYSNYISFHTGYTMLSNKKQVLRLDRFGLSGDAGSNGGSWYFRPYEYGLLTGTYDTVSNNSASWGQSVGGGDVYTSGFEYTTGGNISAYSGSAFVGNEPTFNLVQGYGISMTTANDSLTIANTLVLETGSI